MREIQLGDGDMVFVISFGGVICHGGLIVVGCHGGFGPSFLGSQFWGMCCC